MNIKTTLALIAATLLAQPVLAAAKAPAAKGPAAKAPATAKAPAKAAPAKAKGWGKLVAADGKVIWLTGDDIVIGSAASANARVQHATVSSRHARITHKSGVVHVSDLGSRLGTLVAGTSLRKGKKMQLFQPTTLSFGAIDLRFEWGDRGKLIKPLRKAPKVDKRKAGKKGKKAPAKSARKVKPSKAAR